MFRSMVLIAMALAAGSVQAAPVKNPYAQPPSNVLSAVSGDWNKDGVLDRAVLVADPDNTAADLLVYAGTARGLVLLTSAHDVAYAGMMAGTHPSLTLGKSGALQVYSENEGVGTGHFDRTLTLAWRDNRLVVSGVTLHENDTTNPDGGGSCDINLLTGNIDRAAGPDFVTKRVHITPGAIAVDAWDDDKSVPKPCRF